VTVTPAEKRQFIAMCYVGFAASLCRTGAPIGHGPSVVNPSPAGFLETGAVLRKRQ
jgi:hypothetical protein